MACLRIQLIQRNLRCTNFRYNCLLDSYSHSVFLIGSSHIVRTYLYRILRMPHGYSQSGQLNHGYIAYPITDSYDFSTLHIQLLQ